MRPDADKSVDPASKSAPSTADEKKNAVTNQSESDDKTAALENLPDEEKHILKAQLDSPSVTVTYFSLYRYADAWDYLVLLVSALCAIAGGAALPLFMIFFGELANTFQGVFVNTISYDEFTDELVKYVLYVVYLGIGLFVTDYVSTVGFIYTGERATRKIRERYLEAILRQNIAYFDKIGAGEVTTRITSDTNLIQDGISHKVGLTLTAVSTFVSAFIIAYIRHWKLALICSSTILALVFIMGGSSSFIVKYTQQNLQSAAEGGSVAEEVFSSIRTATAFGSQQRLADQYEKHLKMAEKSGIRMQIIMALMMAGMFSVMYLNYGLGFWMGSRFLVDGSMDIGQVLTILMAILIGSFTLGYATTHAQAFTGAVAAGAKIFATIDRLSPLDPMQADGETLDHVEGTIELRNVKHIYPSRPEIAVMDDVSLLIPAGKTTALVGPSGSGKSTIVGLVERFYSPVRGEILLDGRDIRSLNLRWLRQQISIVSQEPVLFATTIFENIRYGLIGTPLEHETGEKLRQRIEEAAKIANAHDFITSLPDGYNTHVGERGFLLSGGQKQRIAIARAVASDPKILLLDEATSALDTKSEGVVQAALDKAAEGRTTIVIAHRLSTIKNAHNIVVLVGGKIVEQGTHGELIEREGTYAKLVEAQKLNEERDAQAANVASEDDTVDDDSDLQKKISRTVTGKSLEDRKDLGDLEKDAGILERQSTRKSLSSVVLSRDKTEKAEVPYSLWTLFKFVASFNRPEVFYMIIGLVFSVLAGGGQPTQAVFFAKAITALSLPPSMFDELRSEANFWSLMFLMLGIVSFFLFAIQGISFAFCSEKLIRRARNTAFRTMLRQDIVFFDKEENSTGSLTAFLSTETKHLSSISGATLGTILMQISTMVAALVVALAIGWKLALVCISVLPVMLGCGFYRIYAITEFESRAKKAYENSASYACEATSAIRTVASLTREGDILESYREQLREQARRRLISVSWTSLLFAASQALSFFCMALGFWYGGTLLGKGEYTIFQFFVCFSEVMFGSQTAGTVFSFAPDMGKAKNAAAEIKKLLDRKPEIDSSSDEGEKIGQVEGTIEFRDVHFRYPTRPEQPVLRGLSLTVKPGQYVALVGPSGCGKSTTIALLERFYDPLSGAVYVDGKDISALNVTSYRNHLALVSQEPTLYQGTIRENILLGSNEKDIPEEAIINACKNANIYDFILSLPDGLDTVVGSKGVMLSGGQKQRVAIARALLRDPKILLLDEATSALDSESEKVVQEALDNAAQGRTTIAVAHRLSTIQNADVIYVFDQGRIFESGTHAELLRKKGRYYEMVNLQSLSRDN